MIQKQEIISFYNGIKSLEKGSLNSPKEQHSIDIAIKLAYGDAKRTMTGIAELKEEKETAFKNLAQKFYEYFNSEAPSDKNSFDTVHNKLCSTWSDAFSKVSPTHIGTYGKAQKIVNMTFKYLYCCKDVCNFEKHFMFSHVPLDSFTLEWFIRECENRKVLITKGYIASWSSIQECGDKNTQTYNFNNKKYYTYFYYQELFREWFLNNGTNLLESEFENWPKIQKHLAAEAFYFAYKDITDAKEKNAFKKKPLEEKISLIKSVL